MTVRARRWVPLLLIALLLGSGCTRSPEARKAGYLERGDRYFKKEQYREEILEYRNALQIDQKDARATAQLGLAHYQLGEIGQACPYLLRARELAPGNAEVHLKLGTIYLMGRKFPEATQEAETVLSLTPGSLD